MTLLLAAVGIAAGLEKPEYQSLEREGRFELRRYQSVPVARTQLDGMDGRNRSFNRLFRYIGGDNEREAKIAMTAPVIMDDGPADAGDGRPGAMSFMLPAAVAKAGAPQPTGDQVVLGTIEGGKIAALRFKGWTDEVRRRQAVADLKAWIAGKGWQVRGEPIFAFYDPPWTPEFLRRNEVWLRVE
jgi:DNA gyrase inhibitor GyrI